MNKSLVSTALLTLSLFEQASALEALSQFVDEIPQLAGIPDSNTVIPWEFPLTEEDTIKMQNRYAVLLMS